MSLQQCVWVSPPACLNLTPDQVQVWSLNLNPSENTIKRLSRWLSPDEQDRAGRFYFERDQRRFTVGRGYLRDLLGRYLNQDPVTLTFNYTPRGKPYLKSSIPIQFNVSHSNELGILAFGWTDPIGVDVEYQRDMSDWVQLADRFFSPQEAQTVRRAPQQQQTFFQLWTAKEAYLKATGEGLAGLDETEIDLSQGSPQLQGQSHLWQLTQWIPQPEYIATVAFPQSSRTIQYFQETLDPFEEVHSGLPHY